MPRFLAIMDELGHILREARETKGLTLQEVQEETRINTRYLEALESGEYDRLPTPVHVRGFLRNYARFLGLDPQPLLDRYEYGQSQRPQQQDLIANQEPVAPALKEPPTDHQFFDPVNMEVDAGYGSRSSGGGNRSETILRLVIIAALIGFIYLAAQRFIPLLTGEGDGSAQRTEEIQDYVESLLNNEEATEEPAATPDVSPSTVITSTSRNNFSTSAADAEPTPLPTRPPLPATMEQILLDIIIRERAWMEVTIDGDVVFSGIARPDDTFQWEAENEAKILTGNGIGVDVSINGTTLGPLGGRGQNVEETWTTTQ